MGMHGIRDLTHFLAVEEENTLKSFINLGKYISCICDLDELYRSCLDLDPISDPNQKIPCFLFLVIHSEYYISMANFLRLRQSKSFCSLRSALDSVFTAYYLLKNPGKRKVYLSKASAAKTEAEEKEWKDIFLNIKKTVKKDIQNFPHAKNLPEIHELCSMYSHSDPLGIMHRYVEDKEKLMLEAHYFDYEHTVKDYNKWLACLLYCFLRIFLIFWYELFSNKAGNKKDKIEGMIAACNDKISIFQREFPL